MTTTTEKKPVKTWKDETGNEIPVARITPLEKLMERTADKLLRRSKEEHERLKALKALIAESCSEIYSEFLKQHKADTRDRKGNFTWYNFDRSIKVEVSINERIEFDDMTIKLVQEKLMDFIGDNLSGANEFIVALVKDAFNTSRGHLDTKKIMSLLKYRSKIKDTRYHEAMELLEQSIRRPDSKTYFRIWEKNAEGQYQIVDLNFSSI